MANIIIFIHDDYAAGGVQRSAINIRQALVDRGHSVSILAIKLTPGGYSEKHEFVKNVSQDHKCKLIFWPIFLQGFRKELKSNKDSVFIALGLTTSILLGMLSYGIRTRALVGSERIYPPMETPSPLMSFLRYLFFRRLDCVVAQSQKTVEWFTDSLGLKESRLTVIPNVILAPSEQLKTLIARNIHRDSFKGDYPIIACVGRLTTQKGFDYALKILFIVQKKIRLVRLIIVGDDGPEREVLAALANYLGLTDNISFISRLDSLTSIFIKSDILLFPSRYEGFPNVLAEAMAHGLPAVAFDCLTGPADLIEHGVNGFLVAVGDVDVAAELTLTILEDHELRYKFATRAMNVFDKFSPDVVGQRWAALVERVGLRR